MTRRLASAAVVVLAVVAAAAGRARAQPQGIDPEAVPKVHLYTFGVGGEIFEKFGHAALCLEYPPVSDPSRPNRRPPQPVCFNYGVTNFEEPGKLVWGFMRSKQKFWVEPTYLNQMLQIYSQKDRDIFRQTLPLDDDQARAIAAKLWSDTREENKYYIYHHFDDNCTTRLRDMVDDVTGGKLKADSDVRASLSFRGFGRRGMSEFVPLIAVSDFVTGRDLDYYPTQWEAMFHPDVLREQVALKLGVEPELVYARKGPPFATDGPSGRWVIVVLSLLLTAPLVLVRWRGWKRERLAIAVAAFPLMLFGVLLWLIFGFVTIEWVRWNEVMLMYLPFDVAIPFLSPARRRRYAQLRIAMVALASALAAIGVLRQPIWIPALVAFLPLSVLAFDLPPAKVRTKAEVEEKAKAKPKASSRLSVPS